MGNGAYYLFFCSIARWKACKHKILDCWFLILANKGNQIFGIGNFKLLKSWNMICNTHTHMREKERFVHEVQMFEKSTIIPMYGHPSCMAHWMQVIGLDYFFSLSWIMWLMWDNQSKTKLPFVAYIMVTFPKFSLSSGIVKGLWYLYRLNLVSNSFQ